MRRPRLVAAAFAGALSLTAIAPTTVVAASGPVAEVKPRRVHPGGTVTLTVTCGKDDPEDPYITAYSQAFAKGEAKLRLLPRGSRYGKPTYQGTARIAPARNFPHSSGSGSYGSSESSRSSDAYGSSDSYRSDDDFGLEESYGEEGAYGEEESYGAEESYESAEGYREETSSEDSYTDGSYTDESFTEDSYTEESYGFESSSGSHGTGDDHGRGSRHHKKRWGINGSCPGGDDFTTSVVVERKPHGGPPAGQGGSQDRLDPVTVAAGGALLSATVGCAVYVLRRRRSEA